MSEGAIRKISDLIDSTYPVNLNPEAWRWRRCAKVVEEAGEVVEALLGLTGENPRKGVTHTENDLVLELLDVALASLGAVAHLMPASVDPLDLLEDQADMVLNRLEEALD